MGKTNNVVLHNSRNSTVRKYPIRKRNTTVNQTLTDPLIDTDTSFESYDSFANEHSSSSEWKLTSGSDNSTFTITKSHTSPVLKKDIKIINGTSHEYSTLNKKYPAQIYNYISNRNKKGKIKSSSIAVGTKKNSHKDSDTKNNCRSKTIYCVRRHTHLRKDIKKYDSSTDLNPTDDPT